jgi:hypothetical protein
MAGAKSVRVRVPSAGGSVGGLHAENERDASRVRGSGPVTMSNGVRVGGYAPGEAPQDVISRCVEIEGRFYELRKVGSEAIHEIKSHLLASRGNVLEKIASDLSGSNVSPEMQSLFVREAIKAATNSQVTKHELNEFMQTADGAAFMFWLALRDAMPELTREKAESMFYENMTKEAELQLAKKEAEKKKQEAEKEDGEDEGDGGEGEGSEQPPIPPAGLGFADDPDNTSE